MGALLQCGSFMVPSAPTGRDTAKAVQVQKKGEKMNDNRRDQKPEGGIAKLVIFGIVMLFVFVDAIGIDGGSAFFIILMLGAIALAAFAIKKQQAEEKKSAAQDDNGAVPQREFKPQHFDMSKFVGKRAEGESLSKRLTEKMRDDLSRCDDDHEHVGPGYRGTDAEKRAFQLRQMLSNGIIEKDEYNILMRKFGLK